MGETAVLVSSIIGGCAVVVAAIVKFVPPRNNGRTCPMHSGLVSDIGGIARSIEDLREDVSELRREMNEYFRRK